MDRLLLWAMAAAVPEPTPRMYWTYREDTAHYLTEEGEIIPWEELEDAD